MEEMLHVKIWNLLFAGPTTLCSVLDRIHEILSGNKHELAPKSILHSVKSVMSC